MMRDIDAWAKSFDPSKKYTYPKVSKFGVILREQRDY